MVLRAHSWRGMLRGALVSGPGDQTQDTTCEVMLILQSPLAGFKSLVKLRDWQALEFVSLCLMLAHESALALFIVLAVHGSFQKSPETCPHILRWTVRSLVGPL